MLKNLDSVAWCYLADPLFLISIIIQTGKQMSEITAKKPTKTLIIFTKVINTPPGLVAPLVTKCTIICKTATNNRAAKGITISAIQIVLEFFLDFEFFIA